MAQKHSKVSKGKDTPPASETPASVSKRPDEQSKPGEHSEQGHLDSIIFDLLGDKAVEGVTKSAKGVTKSVPDFDAELEAVIAAAFEGLPVRAQSKEEEPEPAKETVEFAKETAEPAKETAEPAAAVREATIPTVAANAPTTFSTRDDKLPEQETQASTVSSTDLIESDKSTPTPPFIIEPIRKRHIWPVFICAIIVFILLTGGITYLNRFIMADQAEVRAEIQREGSGYLDESIALIQEADIVVIALDKAIESQVREEDVPQLEALLEQVDDTQKSLDGAIEVAKKAQETFLEEDRRELARHAQEAAEYRKQMLELRSQLTEFDIAAMKSALSLEYAWSLIVDADADMRAAVEVVNGWGANAVEESRDYNQQAFDKLTLAEEMLATTVTTFPTVDVQLLSDYLEAKKASAELALASDNAFLEGDYDTANIRNEEFIAQDAEAVRLAAAIPSDPLSMVVTAYEKAVGQLREEYKEVRSNAADADAYLRAYLGVDVQQAPELP
ncbi:MAG: hypothetical protein LBK67_00455 [Coriobacteriales bacterium]|nr:hypothetical protein [Coriobacteriales bacterium]